MILRRISKHVKDQNWFAVALDFLIVVVGILIAFQITNWNEARLDRAHEKELIIRLITDFEGIEARLAESLVDYAGYIESVEYVYQIVAEKTPPQDDASAAKFKDALRGATNGRLPAWPSSTYQEMQSTGNIDTIQNKDLKKVLVEYDQATQFAHNAWQLLNNRTVAYSGPLFRSTRFKANLDTFSGTESYYVDGFQFEKMIHDPDFLPYLSAQITVYANNRYLQNRQHQQAVSVLEILRREVSP